MTASQLVTHSTRYSYFYLATRMHSADYAVTRCLPVRPFVCPSVCLSVCLSHAGILSKRLIHIFKVFYHRVVQPFWYFHTKRDGNIPTGTAPLTGASNARRYEKKHPFSPISRFISQMMQYEP